MVTHLKPFPLAKCEGLTSDHKRSYPLLRQQATWKVSHALWPDRGGRFFELCVLCMVSNSSVLVLYFHLYLD